MRDGTGEERLTEGWEVEGGKEKGLALEERSAEEWIEKVWAAEDGTAEERTAEEWEAEEWTAEREQEGVKYVLGIDSGGTKFLIKAMDTKGRIIGSFTGKPACLARIGKQKMAERIEENISGLLNGTSLRRKNCRAIVCGTTGVDSRESRLEHEMFYQNIQGISCPVCCVNDAEAALYAAADGYGVIVISGTGSVAFGRDRFGKTWRCGGWPLCIFGDEGSGTWMNQKALEYLSRVIDGRVQESVKDNAKVSVQESVKGTARGSVLYHMLIKELEENGLKAGTAGELISVCQRIEREGSGFLHLAPVVLAAAEKGDLYAEALIAEEAECTFHLADGVIKNLDFEGEKTDGVWGSAIVKNPLHYHKFSELMKIHYPKMKVSIPSKDAADGACALALKLL